MSRRQREQRRRRRAQDGPDGPASPPPSPPRRPPDGTLTAWRRDRAVRRLLIAAGLLAVGPGVWMVAASTAVRGPSVESLLAAYPPALLLALAWGLHRHGPPVLEARPEALGPPPRPVRLRWTSPLANLPTLLGVFPAIYLLSVLLGERALQWTWLAAVCAPAGLAAVGAAIRARGAERRLLRDGHAVAGVVRWIVADGGLRLKVEYEAFGEARVGWTDDLALSTWFGALSVEERKPVTLVVDPHRPERFLVVPFTVLEVG